MQAKIIPNISVDCIVFGFDGETLKVLLIKQKQVKDGAKPLYALPGDLVFEDEHLDDAAERVLNELTTLKGIYLQQFHAFGDPNRVRKAKDQAWLTAVREFPHERVITIGYYSLVAVEDYHPQAAAFADSTEWIDVYKVKKLAFDHMQLLEGALKSLREGLESQHLSFELLPDKFTLSQLQRLHEIVLNRKLDKRNFRKSVKKLDHVVALDEKQKGVDHKPAQLYQYRPAQEEDTDA